MALGERSEVSFSIPQGNVSQKNKTPQLHQILTDSQNSFTVRLSRKFVTKSNLNTPPHPKRVTTLPCEISVLKNRNS